MTDRCVRVPAAESDGDVDRRLGFRTRKDGEGDRRAQRGRKDNIHYSRLTRQSGSNWS